MSTLAALAELKAITLDRDYRKIERLTKPFQILGIELTLVPRHTRLMLMANEKAAVIELLSSRFKSSYRPDSDWEYRGYMKYKKDAQLIRSVLGELRGIKVRVASDFAELFVGEYTALALGSFILQNHDFTDDRREQLRQFFTDVGFGSRITVTSTTNYLRSGVFKLTHREGSIDVTFKPGFTNYVYFE